MFDITYRGLKLIPSKSAMRELMKYDLTLQDCKEILAEGYTAPRKRASGTEEKWLNKGNKTYNIVIVESLNFVLNERIYLIIHVGKFTRRKK